MKDYLKSLFRYIFVGGIAFIVDYSLLYILTEKLKFYYIFSSFISFIAGLIVNYILSIKFVFEKRKMKNKKLEFMYFSLIGIGGILINQFLMWFFTEKIGFFYMYSKLLSVTIVFLWNFSIRKYFLF
jgi:putative flippase GtrA